MKCLESFIVGIFGSIKCFHSYRISLSVLVVLGVNYLKNLADSFGVSGLIVEADFGRFGEAGSEGGNDLASSFAVGLIRIGVGF